MDDDRVADVLRVCREALAREGAERDVYVQSACGDDADLRREVEALLAEQRGSGENVLDTPPWLQFAPTLAAGQRLGPYEIQSAIAAGGMGHVYKARDTRLDRTVAIKVLPPEFGADRERRARFAREAKTIAGLNHPHICVLHDVGEYPGSTGSGQAAMYLVMEFVAGEPLATRLEKGPLPLHQAITVATEIADALAAAHRQGVIHRDLKPGNVMLTKAGAKLLDFGLAKLQAARAPLVTVATASSVQPATAAGTLLGTVPYMAPEQVEGREADGRSDLFAFGCVLYEMVAGRRAFQGESQASVMAAILEHEAAPLSTVQPVTPPALDRLVSKCLQKDPEARWQTAADLADELRWVASGGTPDNITAPEGPGRRRRLPAAALWLALAAALGTSAIAVWRTGRGEAARIPPTTLAIPVSTSNLALMAFGFGGGLAISPDGQTTVFAASHAGEAPLLFVRRLNESEPQALKETAGGVQPFFSPDGQQVGFFRSGQVMRVALNGGKPQRLITDPDWTAGEINFGGAWGANGRVVFGGGYIRPGIWQVPAEGGRPEQLVKGEEGAFYNFPDVLPEDNGVVFTIYRGGRSSVNAWSRTKSMREVLKNASRARYLPTGHLLYEEGGSLRLVRFNSNSLVTEGQPSLVVEDVGTAWTTATWDVSQAGTVVYAPPYVGLRRLVWRDRRGNTTALPLNERPYLSVSLSPDNQRLVVGIGDGLRRQLWWGAVLSEPLQPLTYGYDDVYHAFSADGRWVAFTRQEKGRYNVCRTPTDGSATVEQLTEGDRPQGLPAFSPDGKLLLFNTPEATGDFHIWQKQLDPPGRARPFIRTPSVRAETHAAFSPNGQWVAYMSNEGGAGYQVWVKPYPDGARIQVSTEGGTNPVWHPTSKELFYQGSTSLMSVSFSTGRPGHPFALFPLHPAQGGLPVYQFAVSRGGDRFLMLESVESATRPSLIYVVSNRLDRLKAERAAQRR